MAAKALQLPSQASSVSSAESISLRLLHGCIAVQLPSQAFVGMLASIRDGVSHLEELPDHAGALAHVLLHQLAANDPDEAGIRPVCHSSRQQRLPSACVGSI